MSALARALEAQQDEKLRAEGMLVGALLAVGVAPHPLILGEALKLVHTEEQAKVAIRAMLAADELMKFDALRASLRRTNVLTGRR